MTDAVSGDVAATFPLRWDAPLGLLYIDGVSNNSRESVVVRTGSRVGHFRILGVLGRGGMGEVYELGRRELNDALGQALARMQPLVAKDPARVLWRTDVASMHEAMASVLLDRGLIAEARGEMNAARESLAKTAESDRLAQRLALRLAVTTGVVAERAGDRAGARAEWTRVIESLWPSRESLRTVGDLDLLARALLHADRVQDAEPILERLGKLGYRQRDLMKLWEAKRNHRPSERAATPSSTLGDDNNKQSGAVVD
jgi:tetratricopeptide (TPR) repeat protein